MNNNIKFTSILILFFLSFCAPKPLIIKSGMHNLEIKSKELIIGVTNKNDVETKIGITILKEYPEENIWFYSEIEHKKNYLGQSKLIKSNFLVVEFDKKGILLSKKILTKNEMKNIEFFQEFTQGHGLNESFSKKLFSSIRKRFLKQSTANQE